MARETSETGKKEIAITELLCTFLILNIASQLQLIPVNVIAYRSHYGSVNPAPFGFKYYDKRNIYDNYKKQSLQENENNL